MIIYMSTVEDKPNSRALAEALYLVNEHGPATSIPAGFEWDGSSVPFGLNAVFPRHRHPIASCRHDWRCSLATCKSDRAYADKEFESDVGKTSWWITKKTGYLGVRIGAFFGIGSKF